jgi:dipeptidyl aminopeptidase/acylaminoacyl peptidase
MKTSEGGILSYHLMPASFCGSSRRRLMLRIPMLFRQMRRSCLTAFLLGLVFPVLGPMSVAGPANSAAHHDFTMARVLHYPYASELVAADHADIIAWVRNIEGVRNIWIARGPAFVAAQMTRYIEDDGQEFTQLAFTPDATGVIYVRGGDHDANWPAEGGLAPDPSSSTEQPLTEIWNVSLKGGAPVKVAEGDAPAISARGQLAYIKNDQAWSAALDGEGKPERLFFDRGKIRELRWSPDGSRLAFVSDRGDHSFIGVFSSKDRPLSYLTPSTGRDHSPRWSPDGKQIAFVRRPGDGGAPEPILTQIPHAWSIWTANTDNGAGKSIWNSPDTLAGSYPDVENEANLHWMAGDRLVFMAYLDDWPHLYSIAATGGAPMLLTPGPYMVEHVGESADHRFIIYDANAGKTTGDADRRHVFRVPVDHATAVELTSGDTLEWAPVGTFGGHVAFVAAGVQHPPSIGMVGADGGYHAVSGDQELPPDFPIEQMVTPRPVSFKAADGTIVHGQLFQAARIVGAKPQPAIPGIIFLHGGPPRQMLLGWHYMSYYSNAYAVNQYLAAHGFVVLAVNYRLGIGYGRAFHQPDRAGPQGAAEYQDVVAGARFLQSLPGVDAQRIGIWGGSYGGYLTALALARNSDIFKVGVDLHGVHDWSSLPDLGFNKFAMRYEKGDRDDAMRIAWESSPDSSLDAWKSPVLLIQGDDDRNVPFQQTIDLARRLSARKVHYEELVLPNEIHGFLRHSAWLRADEATADFLTNNLIHNAK